MMLLMMLFVILVRWQMSFRSLALLVAAFSSMHVASADAQSVYVAPGGVYVGGGPVYVRAK